jgi:predicted RNA-binding protein YlxR (DUF448 family)
VRDLAGLVVIDPDRRAPGRGAYLHPRARCVDAALASDAAALARALRAKAEPTATARLRRDIEGRLQA